MPGLIIWMMKKSRHWRYKINLRLQNYNELIGTLSEIKQKGNHDVVVLSAHWELELPKDAIPKEKLQDLIGERVGIFNAGNAGYKIRRAKTDVK